MLYGLNVAEFNTGSGFVTITYQENPNICFLNSTFLYHFYATLIDRKFTNHEVINVHDWLEGSKKPIFFHEYNRFKEIELTFLIRTNNDLNAEYAFSELIENFKDCIIKFDDMEKYFDCHYSGKSNLEKLIDGVFRVVINLNCHNTHLVEFGVFASGTSSVSIQNAGGIESEMQIKITPTVNISSFAISGLSRNPIVINNLEVGKEHIINGYTYKYTKDGVNDINNYQAFEFPVLPKNTTTVGFSNANVDVAFGYFPKFN